MSESVDFINAAENGDLNTVQSLVDKVNVNSKDEGGYTALYNAAFGGHLDVVRFLVARKDVDVNLADVRSKDCHHISSFTLAICTPNALSRCISLLIYYHSLCSMYDFKLPLAYLTLHYLWLSSRFVSFLPNTNITITLLS